MDSLFLINLNFVSLFFFSFSPPFFFRYINGLRDGRHIFERATFVDKGVKRGAKSSSGSTTKPKANDGSPTANHGPFSGGEPTLFLHQYRLGELIPSSSITAAATTTTTDASETAGKGSSFVSQEAGDTQKLSVGTRQATQQRADNLKATSNAANTADNVWGFLGKTTPTRLDETKSANKAPSPRKKRTKRKERDRTRRDQ